MVVFSRHRRSTFSIRFALSRKKVKRVAVFVFVLPFVVATAARGQSSAEPKPQTGGDEIQIWTGAGHSAINGTGQTAIWNLWILYGVIVTDPPLPPLLRGRLQ